MIKPNLAAVAFGIALAISPFAASPAAACQGPQFESRLNVFSAQQHGDVPQGMVQYRVRISDYSLRNVYQRDLIHVQRLADEPVATGKIEKAISGLKIIKPVGTSCDFLAMPSPGIYYLVGRPLFNADGEPLVVNGGQLFQPKFTRRKAMLDFPKR